MSSSDIHIFIILSPFLQNISKITALILFTSSIGISFEIWFRSVLLVKYLILMSAVHPEASGKEDVKQHEAGTHSHPFMVVWAFVLGEKARAQNGPTLTNKVQYGNTCSATGIRGLVVQDPGEHVTDDREYSTRRQENRKVTNTGLSESCQEIFISFIYFIRNSKRSSERRKIHEEAYRLDDRKEQVSDSSNKGKTHDHISTLLCLISDPSGQYNHQK